MECSYVNEQLTRQRKCNGIPRICVFPQHKRKNHLLIRGVSVLTPGPSGATIYSGSTGNFSLRPLDAAKSLVYLDFQVNSTGISICVTLHGVFKDPCGVRSVCY